MSADVFTRRWLGLFALLSGLIVLAPFLIAALVSHSGCGSNGTCDSLNGALHYHGRWLVLAIVLAPLIVAIAARTLTVGAFAWAFPFAMLMLAGAVPLLVGLSDFTRSDYLDDLLALPALIPLLFLVVLLLALSGGGDDAGGPAGTWRLALGFVALAAAFVTAPAWLIGLEGLPWAGTAAPMLTHYIGQGHAALGITEQIPQLTNTALIGFTLVAAGVMLAGRRGETYRSAYA